jgi:hypothetical protein
VESDADTLDKIIDEIAIARVTERGATRGDDRFPKLPWRTGRRSTSMDLSVFITAGSVDDGSPPSAAAARPKSIFETS